MFFKDKDKNKFLAVTWEASTPILGVFHGLLWIWRSQDWQSGRWWGNAAAPGSPSASWAGWCSQPTKPVPFQLISASQQLCARSSRSCLWAKRAPEQTWLQRLFSKHLSTHHTNSSVNSQAIHKISVTFKHKCLVQLQFMFFCCW